MAASYPTSKKTFTTLTSADQIASAHQNERGDEITAMEAGLLEGLAHPLRLAAATEYTIASGAITIAKGYITIDTESDAAADDLDTITPGTHVGEGSIVICRAENVARVVTLKDGTGNLLLQGDYALDATDKLLTVVYDGSNWREIARAGAGQVTGSWTPGMSFGGATTGITYGAQHGTYVKNGRDVKVTGRVTLTANGTATGAARITGLPFTVENTNGNEAIGSGLLLVGASGTINGVKLLAGLNTTTAILYADGASNGAALDESNLGDTTDVYFSLSYRASA